MSRYEERHECPHCHAQMVVYVRGAQVAHNCPKNAKARRQLTTFTREDAR